MEWRVLPHGPIEKLSENLWWVTGTIKGMSLKRVMAVAKRSDGKLVIHSAIAMDEAQMRELEALGEPAYLVVPSHHHRIDAPAYKRRYPALKVYALLNDAVFNMDTKKDVLGYLFTTVMGSAPGPRVSRLAKLALVDDQVELRANLERYASVPDLVRLMVAHEKVAHGADAPAALRQAMTYLR